jgi:hypothetical protein
MNSGLGWASLFRILCLLQEKRGVDYAILVQVNCSPAALVPVSSAGVT